MAVFEWDEYLLDVAARRLAGPAGEVHVEPQVFDVLALLVEQRERVVPKAELLETVWGDQFVSESALTTRIKQARRALGDDGRTQKYIRNVHGRGYQFVGELDASRTEPARSPSPAPAMTARSLAVDIAVDDEFPFVGRSDELERAEALLRTGERTNTQVHLAGAPGAGKSRLAVELLERAGARGAMVCAGRCEASVTSGLQAVRDAFAQLATNHPEHVSAWAAGVEGQLLSMIPSLADHLDHDPVASDAYAGVDVFLTVFHRVSQHGPLVLLIDDLQWSDEPTRTFLGRLHRRLRGQPVSSLATFRSGRTDLPHEVAGWIRRQERSDDALRLDVGDLDPDAARALVARVMGTTDRDAADELVSTTAGHCLFLTETIRDVQMGQDTATTVADLIVARLARQTAEVRQIIEAGALLGPEFPFAVAATAAGLEPGVALEAIDTAIEAELLHESASASRFRFSHQLVPEAITSSLSRSRRATLHRACAEALEAAGADEVEVAFQLLGAVPLVSLDAAVERSRAAATAARQAKQFDRALRLLERILATDPQTRVRAEVQLEMGVLINLQGISAEAIDTLEGVANTARKNGWTDLFVGAALAHWSQSPYRKPADTSTMALLDEADQLLGDEPSLAKAKVMAKRAAFMVLRAPLIERARLSQAAVDMATELDASGLDRLLVLEARNIAFFCPSGAEEMARLNTEIEALRLEHDVYFDDAAAPEAPAMMWARGDELRRVAQGDADRIAAQPIAEWRDLVLRSTFAAFAGELETARTLCDRAGEIGDLFWGESAFAMHGLGQFFLDLVFDDWSRSKEMLEFLDAAMAGQLAVFAAPLALAQHATGDRATAAAGADQIADTDLGRFADHILGGNALIACAELALSLDHDPLARAAEDALEPLSHLIMGIPWAPSLAAADPLARLALRRGDTEAAATYDATARRLYESLQAPSLVERMDAGPRPT